MTAPPSLHPVNLPQVVTELDTAFDAYEAALLRNDLDVLDHFFWNDARIVRFGVAEIQYGADAVRVFRMVCKPVHPERKILRRVTTTFGNDFGTVSVEFSAPDDPRTGRQMQTWLRMAGGWKIVAAHVSLLES